MTWVIAGLGNPGEEYATTRHNAGRMVVEAFAGKNDFAEWKRDAKSRSTLAKGAFEKALALALLPDTFMNKSGSAISLFVKSAKAAEKLIVVYDDLDLPLGSLKVSFDRSSGGHKGVLSIERALKTRRFVRVRIGVSAASPGGKLKKPRGEKAVEDFILGEFKASERTVLKKTLARAGEAIATIIAEGYATAMNRFN